MAATLSNGSANRRPNKKALESSPADNIDVKRRSSPGASHRSSRPTDEDSADNDTTKHSAPNRPWGRSGKAPVKVESSQTPPAAEDEHGDEYDDGEDFVEEYDFTNEPSEAEIVSEDELEEDANSAITLSSDPPTPPEEQKAKEVEPSVLRRPWLDKGFTTETRKAWESMFAQVTPYAIQGSWATTEDYQRAKDEEMVSYLEDYPLDRWVIQPQQATSAWNQLVERQRWRNYGIPIYGRDRVPAHPNTPTAPPPPSSRNARPPPPGPGPSQHLPVQHSSYPPLPYQPGAPLPMHQGIPHQQVQHGMPMQMAHPQHMGPAPHPNRGQLPPNLVPLPSQPYAQPLPMHHGPPHPGMGYPVGPVQTLSYGMPLGTFIGQPMPSSGRFPPVPALPRQRKPRERKETPVRGSPVVPVPIPPYPHRDKPVDAQKASKRAARNTVKGGRRQSQRRPAEADDFPWTRDLNFPEEKDKAHWDETIYSAETLESMKAARYYNSQHIDNVDAKLGEAQRQARFKKRGLIPESDPSKAEADAEAKPKERKKRNQNINDASDPNTTGSYSWADRTYGAIGKQMGYDAPMDAIWAGIDGHLTPDQMAQLKIVWNPSKKGGPEGLRPAEFTVRDSVLTRQQLEKTPILTFRAAECLIDFCPELLWRGTLLRVTSEGGHGNKDVRDRFCHNGSYCDKATITKRISAALGQKQVQPKSKGYQEGEYEWYEQNVKDYTNYIEFFGVRTGHRNMLKIQMQSDKRKTKMKEKSREDSDGSAGEQEGSNKRRKLDANGTHNSARESEAKSEAKSEANEAGAEETESAEDTDEDDDDAVSAQDSDILDQLASDSEDA